MNFLKKFSIILVTILLIAGCSSNPSTDVEKDLNLKIGLMPAVDSAPILLAEEQGYFEDLGLNLESTIYTNAVNRQSALQSGELDGTMTDLIAFINNKHNGFESQIVTSTDGSFAFLVGQDFVKDGKKLVGLMEISVSNYLTDNYIAPEYDIEKIFIPEIPTRLEMINTAKLDMAFIPEPVASMGQLSGLEKLLSITDDDGYMPEAMVFTSAALSEKSEAIELFIKGYNKAVEDINRDESLARNVLIKEIKLNPEITDMIDLPQYKKARVPSEEYLDKIISWIEMVQEIDVILNYEDMVEGKFVQQ